MSQEHWNLLVKITTVIWAVGGPLLGVLIGAQLTNRNQRRQWLADRKMQEYRELISAITLGFRSMLHQFEPVRTFSPEDQRTMDEQEEHILITITDRVFIAQEVIDLKVMERWLAIRQGLRETPSITDLGNSVAKLKYDLVNSAMKLT